MREEIRRALTPPPPDQMLTSAAFSDATGITLRCLQWWDQENYFKPEFGLRGHTRYYSRAQIKTALRLKQMRAAGVPLYVASKLVAVEGWDTVEVLNRPKVVAGVLLVPPMGPGRTKPPAQSRPARRATGPMSDDMARRLDEIAMRDPQIAERRVAPVKQVRNSISIKEQQSIWQDRNEPQRRRSMTSSRTCLWRIKPPR